ncbi:hypothetical protein [Marinifilum breve]|nr:hypothetical protein [Marinifilum breve]
MKYNDKILNVVYTTIIIVSIIVILIYKPLLRKYKLNKLEHEGVYTIGYIYEISDPIRSTPFISYYYYINGAKLKGIKPIEKYRDEFVGHKYYVKTLRGDFSFSEILLYKPVKKKYLTVPLYGWEELPE